MIEQLKKIFLQRALLISMAKKSLRSQYVGSILGISWAIVNPLVLMITLSFIFSRILKTEIRNFPLFILSAIIPWTFFSSVLSEVTNSIVNGAGIIKQFSIPRIFIPLSLTLVHFINFIIGLFILLPIFVFFNPEILFLIPFLLFIMFLYLIFISGIALLFSTLNVYFRDIIRLVGIMLMFLFWITPVFYSFESVPQSYRWICLINPITIFISIYRNILFNGTFPGLIAVFWAFLTAFSSFTIGLSVFTRYEPYFTKKI